MRRIRCTGWLMHAAVLLAALLCAARAQAIDVWMPETGEVDLEAPPDSAEAQFHHAAALIAAEQPVSGVRMLRGLLSEHPDAEWVEHARYMVALGLLAADSHAKAFNAWQEFLVQYPESTLRPVVYERLLQAAGGQCQQDLEAGFALYDRLIEDAPSEEFAARARVARADAAFETGSYMRASDAYLALIDYHPDSPWVPYAWYRIGQCSLRTAQQIGRGDEHLEDAERTLRGFVANFPEHTLAQKAREDIEEARGLRARHYRAIAEFYLGPAGRATSSLPYLHYLSTELAGTPEAEWAKKKIEEVLAAEEVPVKGHYPKLSLPGVIPQKREEAETE